MDLKQELINRLGVPENWDKYDYQKQRYSFDDMHEVLEDIVKNLILHVVVFNEADLVSSESINDAPEPLWKSYDLGLEESEVELCDKNENRFRMCYCCGDNNCHDAFCKG